MSYEKEMMNRWASEPMVSIVIPVHNGGEQFKRCLSSAVDAISHEGEIIVVADGDTDGSWQFAKKIGVKVLKIPKVGGPAKARNLGAREATGDILFFFDADVALASDTIECVTAVFRDNFDLAALFGSYDDEPFETNLLSQYKNLLHHYVHQTSKEDAFSFWTGCGAIRREIFMEMGGFNETYRNPSIEDIELGYRLKKAGHKIRLVKEIQVKHLKRWRAISMVKTDFFSRALPWTSLILKENLLADDLNLKTSARISTILVYLLLFMGILAPFSPWLLIPIACCTITLLALNRDLYLFFINKRGLGFAIRTLPWHWLYFFYSGLAFVIGYGKYWIKRK